ncbi:2-oxo-4-hydroxy-4-carboxy-5-ureidoimidazoline decarboxylase [Streptomyces corynorhini]|uniref:2-oxo-4-hydroxy-4-carboxy-5-ureidoimidazoline decarboxylase n=1 Tax=Streptomyces corynorhini TaxID=2282652 RepID=A0A370B8Z3_9ACTN|nr:2-oxo-4-hydroxy-4-carboxy-5-ureidoimidazoline decarboxylase [Streptomyces corynorhini]RDG36206.1 2-oxo-4-hydroxy-4-carboxy-5-ureidoimidazoline decarboxylase [Streptomyces corynorhini]
MTSTPAPTPAPAPAPPPGLARFNAAPDRAALAGLREVCAAAGWGSALLAGRPYATADALLAASDAATAALDGADLDEALAGHPPIGRPAEGDAVSAREQRGMADASEVLRAEMLALNLAYQEKFGHVFLICATGASAEGMRDALRDRLGRTPERERETARAELGKINRIRLVRLAEAPGAPAPAPVASVSTHVLDTSAGRPAAGVPVSLAALTGGGDARWVELGGSTTDADGRCRDLPALPESTTRVRLDFATEEYLATRHNAGNTTAGTTPDTGTIPATGPDPAQDTDGHTGGGAPFFPEVTITFRVGPGEHYHVPLLLNPFGYSVYRGS